MNRLYADEDVRCKGYGSQLLKLGIARLSTYRPLSIGWSADPIDNYGDTVYLKKLEQFYRSVGGVKVSQCAFMASSDFEYPLQLAASLAILNPIFSRQQLCALKPTKPNDPWKVVVSYLKPEDFGYEKEKDDCYKLIKKK